MAVYEHSYSAYDGERHSALSRFLVIPRYALRDVFSSKLLTTFYILSFVYPLIAAILVYLHHNTNALAMLKLDVAALLPIDASFFQTFVEFQSGSALILTVLMAPPMISRDLSNNALPLYLCRPLSRTEYVAGKMTAILFLLSLTTWIPGLLIFGFQSTLAGFDWLRENVWMLPAIVFGFAVWIVMLSLLSLAVSSLVKWRVVASGALLGIFFVPGAFSGIVNELFETRVGHLFSLWTSMVNIWSGMFWRFEASSVIEKAVGRPGHGRLIEVVILEPPLWCSWLVVAFVCLICVWLLSRKVRAYEVIK